MKFSRRLIEALFHFEEDLKKIEYDQIGFGAKRENVFVFHLQKIPEKDRIKHFLESSNDEVDSFLETIKYLYMETSSTTTSSSSEKNKILKNLCQEIFDFLESLDEYDGKKKIGLDLPPWSIKPMSLKYLPRTEIIDEIINKFIEINMPMTILLHGKHGCGKTSLTVEFVNDKRVRNFFPGGFLKLHFGSPADVARHKENLDFIYKHLYCLARKNANYFPVEDVNYSLEYIKNLDQVICNLTSILPRVLVILDDVQDMEEIQHYGALGLYCLVTSRQKGLKLVFGHRHEINISSVHSNEENKIIFQEEELKQNKPEGEKYSMLDKYFYLVLFCEWKILSVKLCKILWDQESEKNTEEDLLFLSQNGLICADNSGGFMLNSAQCKELCAKTKGINLAKYQKEYLIKLESFCKKNWSLLPNTDPNLWKVLFQCCKERCSQKGKPLDGYPEELIKNIATWITYGRACGSNATFHELLFCIKKSSSAKQMMSELKRIYNFLKNVWSYYNFNEEEDSLVIEAFQKTLNNPELDLKWLDVDVEESLQGLNFRFWRKTKLNEWLKFVKENHTKKESKKKVHTDNIVDIITQLTHFNAIHLLRAIEIMEDSEDKPLEALEKLCQYIYPPRLPRLLISLQKAGQQTRWLYKSLTKTCHKDFFDKKHEHINIPWYKWYDVTSQPYRGHVLIINNEEDRLGSALDVMNLRDVFQELNYKVQMSKNLTKSQMLIQVKDFVKMQDHESCHAAGLVIMSHGAEGVIFSNNRQESIPIVDLLQPFKSTQFLKNKPIFVIFQACRGKNTWKSEKSKNTNAVDGLLRNVNSVQENKTPTTIASAVPAVPAAASSCLFEGLPNSVILYSALPTYFSDRHTQIGALFIKRLWKVLRDYGATKPWQELAVLISRGDVVSECNIQLTKNFFLDSIVSEKTGYLH